MRFEVLLCAQAPPLPGMAVEATAPTSTVNKGVERYPVCARGPVPVHTRGM